MRAVQFGAGNIGRGFIGAVLEQAGYHVVYADVNQEVIDLINEKKEYSVLVKDVTCIERRITNISAVNSLSDEAIEEIVNADIVTTAVGAVNLVRVAPIIAKGIIARYEISMEHPLNIIACENTVRATSQLKEEVFALLSDEHKAYCEEWVGFSDCSVDRIVPLVKTENPIDVVVESFYEWIVEKRALVGKIPHIAGTHSATNLIAFIERKLFTLNTGHAITAYIGRLHGKTTIDESIADAEIYAIVKGAMQESGMSLVANYGFDKEEHFAYIDTIIDRFRNPYLKDNVTRVGREPLRKLSESDRLVKPLLTAHQAGIETPNLLLGIGAALHYSNPEDEQSVELQNKIAELGLVDAIREVTSIEDEALIAKIVEAYHKFD